MINLRDKSQGTSFINLTYFKCTCGDDNLSNIRKYDRGYSGVTLRLIENQVDSSKIRSTCRKSSRLVENQVDWSKIKL